MRSPSLQLAALELARLAGRRETYVYRMPVLGLLVVAVFFTPGSPEAAAAWMLRVAQWLQFAAVYVLAPLMAVPALQREKDERTLDLLILADTTGWDVMLAKFIPPFLASGLLVLSTLPMVSFASFFGGIEVGTAAVHTLVNLAWAAAACGLGLFAASVAATATRSLILAYGMLGIANWVLYVLGQALAGLPASVVTLPVFGIGLESLPGAIGLMYVCAARSTAPAAIAVVSVACAAWIVRNGVPEVLVVRPWRRAGRLRTRRGVRNADSLEAYLGHVLLRSCPGHASPLGMAIAALLVAVLPVSVVFCLGWSVGLSLACAMNIVFLHALRISGVLEDLSLTSLTDEELFRGLRACMRRRLRPFVVPLFVASVMPALFVVRIGFDAADWAADTVVACAMAAVVVRNQLRFAAMMALQQARRNVSLRSKIVSNTVLIGLGHAILFLFLVALLAALSGLGALVATVIVAGAYHIMGQDSLSWDFEHGFRAALNEDEEG